MTTPQNRQPKGITAGGQFTAATHPESALLLDRNTREVILAPGDADTFQELADGDVIEILTVARSEGGEGYWISPAKTVNIQDLITDSDPRLHGENLEAWLEKNSPVIEDFLAERYDASITTEEGWDSVGVECTAQLPEGPLTEARIMDAAWNGTKVVQLHNESDHGSFGSENLGRLVIERVNGSTVLADPYAARSAGLHMDSSEMDRMVEASSGNEPVSDAAAVAIAKQLSNLRNARGIVAYPAVGRLANRGYVDTAEVDLELSRIHAANERSVHPDPQLNGRIEAMRSWLTGRAS